MVRHNLALPLRNHHHPSNPVIFRQFRTYRANITIILISIIIIRLLLLLRDWLKWRCHSYKLLQGHCSNTLSLIRKWLQKKCLFELLSERGEWLCSSNVRWQGVPCPCSWHRERSITQRWITRRRYVMDTAERRVVITGQLQWLGEVGRCSVIQAPVG